MTTELPGTNCEEFAEMELAVHRDAAQENETRRAAWEAHLRACARCAAEVESLRELRGWLQPLAEATRQAQTPARVEMQLLRQVRLLGYRRRWARRRAGVAGVVLAAAAVLVAAMAARHWMRPGENAAGISAGRSSAPLVATEKGAPQGDADSTEAFTAAATAAQDDFTFLPDGLPVAAEEASIVQVRMQRAALAALGMPVNEELSGEWVKVELLVSADGQPQAVRMLR